MLKFFPVFFCSHKGLYKTGKQIEYSFPFFLLLFTFFLSFSSLFYFLPFPRYYLRSEYILSVYPRYLIIVSWTVLQEKVYYPVGWARAAVQQHTRTRHCTLKQQRQNIIRKLEMHSYRDCLQALLEGWGSKQ